MTQSDWNLPALIDHTILRPEATKADVDADEASSYSSDSAPAVEVPEDTTDGSLASDEALQALREKLTGGQ